MAKKKTDEAATNEAVVVEVTENLSFLEKVVRVQNELKAPKNQYNKFGNYKYRSCEDILEGVKPILSKYGLLLTVSDEVVLIGQRYYVRATATLFDGEKSLPVTALAREVDVKKGMDGSQITGAASSYARKYALNGMFCIDDTKDADATNEHGNGKQAQQVPQQPQQPAPQPTPNPSQQMDLQDALNDAIEDMKLVTSRAEFEEAWHRHPKLHNVTEFRDVAQKIGAKYPKQ